MPPCKGGQEAMQRDQTSSACPVPDEARRPVYNVYNQRIDGDAPAKLSTSYESLMNPSNNMPAVANQQPAPGQRELLSTNREASTIPKGGTQSTWVYPSPQMFYNGALILDALLASSPCRYSRGTCATTMHEPAPRRHQGSACGLA
jgi:cytochrome c heme-lyase